MPVRLRKGKHRDTWQVDVSIKGHPRVKFSAPEARTKKDAQLIEASVVRKLYEGKWGKESGGESFESFFREKYMPWAKDHKRSWQTDEQYGRTLCGFLKGKAFKDLSPLLFEKLKKHLRERKTHQGEGCKPATVNRVLALASRIINLARDEGYTNSNPLARVRREKVDNARHRYLDSDEQEQLLTALEADNFCHLRPMILLDLHTGIRFGELLQMEASDIHLAEDMIVLAESKTKERRKRKVPLNDVSRQIVRELLEAKSPYSERLFYGPRFTRGSVRHTFARAVKASELVNVHFHDLRRTFATRLLNAGVMEYVISSLLGHSVQSVTGRYAVPTLEAQRDAVKRLVQYRSNGIQKVVVLGGNR